MGGVATLAVVALAVGLRLGPTLAEHALRGLVDYDDGVHLGAAVHLLAGRLPYRDYTFVQPPGIVVLLAPAAALARWIGEPDTLALLRVLMAVLGAVNALLAARCAAVWGRRAAVTAGLFYAVWPAAVASERTVLLEPVLTALLLVALLLLRGAGRRGPLPAGLLIGLAVSVKVVAAPAAVVIGVWVLLRLGRRAFLVTTAAAVAAAVVVCAPFVALAPSRAWRMVVLDQFGRPRSGEPVAVRAGFLDGLIYHDTTLHGLVPLGAVVLLVALTLAAVRAPAQRVGAWLWWALLVVMVAEVAVAPSYYYHYGALAAGPAAVLAGLAVARVSQLRGRRLRPLALAVVALVGVGYAGLSAVSGRAQPVPAGLAAFLAAHPCASATSEVLLAGADDLRSVRDRCATPVDSFGVSLDTSRGLAAARAARVPDRLARRLFDRTDAVVLVGPPDAQGWSAATLADFRRRYRPAGGAGNVGFWVAAQPPR
jgi:alpha-1,2-mannosyltransferase